MEEGADLKVIIRINLVFANACYYQHPVKVCLSFQFPVFDKLSRPYCCIASFSIRVFMGSHSYGNQNI